MEMKPKGHRGAVSISSRFCVPLGTAWHSTDSAPVGEGFSLRRRSHLEMLEKQFKICRKDWMWLYKRTVFLFGLVLIWFSEAGFCSAALTGILLSGPQTPLCEEESPLVENHRPTASVKMHQGMESGETVKDVLVLFCHRDKLSEQIHLKRYIKKGKYRWRRTDL